MTVASLVDIDAEPTLEHLLDIRISFDPVQIFEMFGTWHWLLDWTLAATAVRWDWFWSPSPTTGGSPARTRSSTVHSYHVRSAVDRLRPGGD